jgi:hypothetical protein
VTAAVAGPVSSAGAYLRATATNAPADGRLDDESRRVFAYAFRLAVAMRFGPDSPLTEITLAVARAAQRHAAVGLAAREAEMLVRDALGETVPVSGIEIDQIVAAHVLLFAAFVDEMALIDDELDELIVAAEHQAGPLQSVTRPAYENGAG